MYTSINKRTNRHVARISQDTQTSPKHEISDNALAHMQRKIDILKEENEKTNT